MEYTTQEAPRRSAPRPPSARPSGPTCFASVVWPSQCSSVDGTASRLAYQFQGRSRSSSVALIRPEAMRSSMSVSHACGSAPTSYSSASRTLSRPWLQPRRRRKLLPRAATPLGRHGRGGATWAPCPVQLQGIRRAPKYFVRIHAGCAPMMERTRPGVRLQRSKKAAVAPSRASTLSKSSQWVTSRRKCRHSISIGFSHGL